MVIRFPRCKACWVSAQTTKMRCRATELSAPHQQPWNDSTGQLVWLPFAKQLWLPADISCCLASFRLPICYCRSTPSCWGVCVAAVVVIVVFFSSTWPVRGVFLRSIYHPAESCRRAVWQQHHGIEPNVFRSASRLCVIVDSGEAVILPSGCPSHNCVAHTGLWSVPEKPVQIKPVGIKLKKITVGLIVTAATRCLYLWKAFWFFPFQLSSISYNYVYFG